MEETKILFEILKNNQWFDIFKMKGDIRQMMKSIYNMRIYHGQLIIMQHTLIQKVLNDKKLNQTNNSSIAKQKILVTDKEFQKILKKISFIESTNESCKKLISDSENIVKNYILNNKFKQHKSRQFKPAKSPDLKQIKPKIGLKQIDSDDTTSTEKTLNLKRSKYDANSAMQSIVGVTLPKSVEQIGNVQTIPKSDLLKKDSNPITCIAGKNKPTIVNFYVKWCKYSSAFMPVWKNISSRACANGFNVLAIDCDEKKRFCNEFGIVGFPCVRLLVKGRVIEFTEARTNENLTKFILQHTNIKI